MVATVATSPLYGVRLPPSPQTPRTYGAPGPWPPPVPPRVPDCSVFAAETLELAEVLEETVVAGPARAMVTLLTARLCTAHSGSFLLTEDTLQAGATAQLSSDVGREEPLHPLLLIS